MLSTAYKCKNRLGKNIRIAKTAVALEMFEAQHTAGVVMRELGIVLVVALTALPSCNSSEVRFSS